MCSFINVSIFFSIKLNCNNKKYFRNDTRNRSQIRFSVPWTLIFLFQIFLLPFFSKLLYFLLQKKNWRKTTISQRYWKTFWHENDHFCLCCSLWMDLIFFSLTSTNCDVPKFKFFTKNQNQLKTTTKRFFQFKVVFKKLFSESFVTQQANWKH